jgi:hypothetical protein
VKERWNRPMEADAVETVEAATVVGGRAVLDVHMRLSPETIERIRAGRMCINCYEPLPEAWPEVCPMRGCNYRVRDWQAEEFARLYRGTERNPRAALLEQELARVDDIHERNFYVPNSGIIIPGKEQQ